MTLPANIRVNVRASFPALVKGEAFINVAKKNGVWSITPNYTKLTESFSLAPTQVVVVQDTLTGVFTYVPVTQFAGGESDAVLYRMIPSSGSWVALAADEVLLVNPSPAGPVTIQLLASASRLGEPIFIKDYARNANTNNITIAPASGETIDGLSAAAALANGIALIDTNGGSRALYPLTSGGWYTID